MRLSVKEFFVVIFFFFFSYTQVAVCVRAVYVDENMFLFW